MPFNIGAPELIIILVIALLILGPGKLPEVGSSVGKAIREFRKASSDVEDAAKIDVSPLAAAAPAAPAASVAAAPAAPAAAPTAVVPEAPVAPAAAPVAPEVPVPATPVQASVAPSSEPTPGTN